jgi:hypothetical protein
MGENAKPLQITVDKVSSREVNHPMHQVGFTFIISGWVYQVYEVRDRGNRVFVKCKGKARK